MARLIGIDEVVAALDEGSVVAVPTESSYALAARIDRPAALAALARLKPGRNKPIGLMIAHPRHLPGYVADVPPVAFDLVRAYWPGPLTLVFRATHNVPEAVQAGTQSVGVRQPGDEDLLALLDAVGAVLLPLAIGFTIAYVLAPLIDGAQRLGIGRLIATGVLFALFLFVTVLLASMVLPAVMRQSVDLAERTFQEYRYLDLDENGRYDRGEPRLSELDVQAGVWFHDRDGDGEAGVDEPRYREDRHPLRVSPSLAGHLMGWFDDQQTRLERLVGLDLDDRARAFLGYYRRQTADLRAILDAGIRSAESGLPPAEWPAELAVDPGALTTLGAHWGRAWAGVDRELFQRAAAQLPEEHRERWRAAMDWYGRALALLRHDLMRGWSLVRGRAGAGDDGSTGLLNDDRRKRLQALISYLPAALEPARPTLRSLLASRPQDHAAELRSSSENPSDDDEEATERLLVALRQAEEGGVAYAHESLDQLRERRAEGGGVVLRDIVDRASSGVREGISSMSERVAEGLTGLITNLGGLFGLALDLILIPIYAFFLALAMPLLRRRVRDYLPARGRERSIRLIHDIERVVAAFFRGRLIVCLICAILVWIGFALLGVPYAALFGILIGLATAVPLAGLIFLIPACLLLLVEGGDGMLLRLVLVVGVYATVQTLEIAVFTPTIMGREVELHPVVLIVALLLCGYLLGILGLILAVPIAASVRILAREYLLPRMRRLAEGGDGS